MLLVAPGLTTSNKRLLVTKGIATRSKDATSSLMCASLVKQEIDLFWVVSRNQCVASGFVFCVFMTISRGITALAQLQFP